MSKFTLLQQMQDPTLPEAPKPSPLHYNAVDGDPAQLGKVTFYVPKSEDQAFFDALRQFAMNNEITKESITPLLRQFRVILEYRK